MVLAVFSDVHGNRPALDAVLAAIDREQTELVINLGDIASGAVDPRGTLDLLLARREILTLSGNHERQLLERRPQDMSGVDQLAYGALSEGDREWLRALPARLEPCDDVLAFHGAPGDDLCYLLETVTPDGLRQATDAEILERLGAEAGGFRVYLCGHTHLQRERTLPDGSLVVNPGSVGWPAFTDETPHPHRVEAGSPHARYATLVRSDAGWAVTQHRVEYDVEAAVWMAEHNGRPDIARALRTGRV